MQTLLLALASYFVTGIVVSASPLMRSVIAASFWIMGADRWRVIAGRALLHVGMIGAWPVLLPGAVARGLWLERIGLGAALRLALASYRPLRRASGPLRLQVGPDRSDVVVIPPATEAQLARGRELLNAATEQRRTDPVAKGEG